MRIIHSAMVRYQRHRRSRISKPPIQFIGAASQSSGAQLVVPGSPQVGDLMMMAKAKSGYSSHPPLPAGWTSLFAYNTTSDLNRSYRLMMKFRTESDPVQYLMDTDFGGCMCVYRGVDAVDAGGSFGSGSGYWEIPAINPVPGDGSWIFYFGGAAGNADGSTSSATTTQRASRFPGSIRIGDSNGPTSAFATVSGWFNFNGYTVQFRSYTLRRNAP